MKPKRKKWVCPECGKGKLGLQRPRKNDIVRYCFPCSEKSGYLVERISPKDEAKKAKKAAKKAKKAAKKKAAKNKTKLVLQALPERFKAKKKKATNEKKVIKKEWYDIKRYQYNLTLDGEDTTVNIMKLALALTKPREWNNTYYVDRLATETRLNEGKVKVMRGDYEVKSKGMRIQRSKSKGYSVGRASRSYGVTVTAGTSLPSAIITILHEIGHVSQDGCPIVNGKRRPHDLKFNQDIVVVAKKLWGYPKRAESSFSIGNGYAPTRVLRRWFIEELAAGNTKIVKWFKKFG